MLTTAINHHGYGASTSSAAEQMVAWGQWFTDALLSVWRRYGEIKQIGVLSLG